MFARVQLILLTRTGVPVILKEAIVGTDHAVSVYVVEGSKAAMRMVELGLRQGHTMKLCRVYVKAIKSCHGTTADF